MSTITPEALALVPIARAALEKMRMQCPGDGVSGQGGSVEHSLCHCTRCDDTGFIPHSQAAAFLEVLRKPCLGCPVCRPYGEIHHGHWFEECICRGTGYVDYPWKDLPQGALAGALVVASFNVPNCHWSLEPAGTPGLLLMFYVGGTPGDADSAALGAVLGWAKEGV